VVSPCGNGARDGMPGYGYAWNDTREIIADVVRLHVQVVKNGVGKGSALMQGCHAVYGM